MSTRSQATTSVIVLSLTGQLALFPLAAAWARLPAQRLPLL
jgi:hypothetical protein